MKQKSRNIVISIVSVSFIALSLVSMLTSCGGSGGSDPDPSSGPDNQLVNDNGSDSGSDNSSVKDNLKFSLSGAVSVYTTDEQQTGAPLKKGGDKSPDLPVFRNATGFKNTSSSFNLFSVDANGISAKAIESNLPVRVLFTVKNPVNDDIYVALDASDIDSNNYKKVIAENNCAIFRVNTKNNTHACLIDGVAAYSPYQSGGYSIFAQYDGANKKPIQFDENGNIFIMGSRFTVPVATEEDEYINITDSSTLFKIKADYSSTEQLTQDNVDVSFFTVMGNGDVVVSVLRNDYMNNDLVLYPGTGGGQITLNGDIGYGGYFVDTDTYRSFLYGNWLSGTGINMVRSLGANKGVERATLDYNNELNKKFDGKTYEFYQAARIIVANDGSIYAAYDGGYCANNCDDDISTSFALLFYRMLPFKADPIVVVNYTGDWWSYIGQRPLTVSQGVLFYVENIDRTNFGKVDVIKMLRLRDGKKGTLFAADGDPRYRIDSWRATDNKLYFSGLDQGRNVLVQGIIDTKAIYDKADWTGAFTTEVVVKDSASALESSAKVQDIEIIDTADNSQDSTADPQLVTKESTSKSGYLSFNKHMNRDDVESKLSVISETTGKPVALFPLWINKNLHLVYDTSAKGLGDGETTGLTNGSGKYTLTLAQTVDRDGGVLAGVTDPDWFDTDAKCSLTYTDPEGTLNEETLSFEPVTKTLEAFIGETVSYGYGRECSGSTPDNPLWGYVSYNKKCAYKAGGGQEFVDDDTFGVHYDSCDYYY